ncbi:MAG: hypothetical protein ABIF09_14500, partial [Gemmatimonadota bacterium]
ARLFRKSLVSLPATAARNAIESGGFRQVLNVTNRAISVTMGKVFGPGGNLYEPVDPFGELGRIFTTKGFNKTQETLDKLFKGYPEYRNKLLAAVEPDLYPSVSGVTGTGKGLLDRYERGVDTLFLWLNRTQSVVVRNGVMAAALDRKLKQVGLSLEEVVDFGKIPTGFDKMMSEAIDMALYSDFTLAPKGKGSLEALFQGYAKLIDSSKVLPFLEPFPRFVYNATKLISEQMPTGGLRLISPTVRGQMLEGNFDGFARELTGSALFATALSIRQGEFPGLEPGERYDEIKTASGNLVSMSPFVTLAPFLFLADLVIRIDEGRLQPSFEALRDLRRGILGTAPQLATGNAAIDAVFEGLLDIKEVGKGGEGLAGFAGQTATGYLRPYQLLRDFRAEWNEAVAIQRETQGRGFWAPTVALLDPDSSLWVPIAETLGHPEGLPERASPTRGEAKRTPRLTLIPENVFGTHPALTIGAGLFSQVSGALVREPRTAIESEITKLGFTGRDLSPKTGNKQFDSIVAHLQGAVLGVIGNAVVRTPHFLALNTPQKTEVVRNLLNLSREPALIAAKQVAPTMAAQLKLQRMPATESDLIVSQLDIFLRSGDSGLTATDILDKLTQLGVEEMNRVLIPQTIGITTPRNKDSWP